MHPWKARNIRQLVSIPCRHGRNLIIVCTLFFGSCSSMGSLSGYDVVERPVVEPMALTDAKSNVIATALPITREHRQIECAQQLPLSLRVGQLMFPLIQQVEFEQAEQLASRGLLGGIVVLGTPNQSIQSDIEQFQSRSIFSPTIVAVDEEGGRVQRLSRLTSSLPSARKVAFSKTPTQARELAAAHARAIKELGFTMNLAPVADLDLGHAMGDRSFGKDPGEVTGFAMAVADGILDAGLVPVLKHFPGHGRGTDSHSGLPTIPEVKILMESDLIPFMQASKRGDIPIMIGHLVVEGLTDGLPATVSVDAVSGLLRGELGFDGLVISDAFNMNAISLSMSDAEAAGQNGIGGATSGRRGGSGAN